MKVTALIFSLLLSISIFANTDSELAVYQDGLTVEVVDFEDGDKLKLFELETGDHILSKSYSRIDLSQLPVGSYLLENSAGKSIIIDRLEEELMIDGAVVMQDEEFALDGDAEIALEENEEINAEEESIESYVGSQKNQLAIQREGSVIVVLDFEEGDKLKLFEVKDTIHVLSKTTNVIDLSQLPVGVYLLENSKGDSVIVEKFTEAQNSVTDL
ncbi:hypothetical protein [Aquimarina sp. 2201CG14-23]|uniref:hypothetical protein n=1 Tax=Aquimarina mycalae TaxID=3040073 RepID=UPI00247819BD|nr:hypothetical protein [Aquimarina sp. 2201CG14-23]MDH7444435.1 hypothetical protein [Aquimarina sp. 2201CG14-23]